MKVLVMQKYIFILLVTFCASANAQKLRKDDKLIVNNLQSHVSYLSSDKLEGRRTGTAGEQLAMKYISDEFKKIGLQPKGTQEYYQPFEISEGKEIQPSTHLTVGGQSLILNKDYFPMVYSANASLEALPSMAIQEVDMPWFINIREWIENNKNNPHYNVDEAIQLKAKEAKEKGATALFIYNTSNIKDNLQFRGKSATATSDIPVIYITKDAVKKYFEDEFATLDIDLKVDILPKSRSGNNIIGYIDNKSANTVVVGAHFDHLGYGEDGNSLQQGAKQIHNGADDNASGTALLIELARLLKTSNLSGANFLFIAFSGEELGLFGSKYFTDHPTVDISKINYMINMDMVGRLNDANPVITVGGYGTTPYWAEAFALKGKKGLNNGSLLFKFDSSGTGPSDHTSFYLKNIPVLFYFTGLHSDYHKPTDDADKINYIGQLQLVKHIYSLIEAQTKANAKLPFTATKSNAMNTTAQFSVTLGIMPDYSYTGDGVRIDGISEARPAQKAGIKEGDVIIKMGNYPIHSLESYMQALSKFNKGEKTTVYFNRGTENLSTPVEF